MGSVLPWTDPATFHQQAHAIAAPPRHFDQIAVLASEHEQEAAERISLQYGLDLRGQAIEARAHVGQMRERLALIEQTAKAAAEQHATELARLNASIQSERHMLGTELLRAQLAKVRAKAEAAEQSHQEQRKSAAQAAHRAAEHDQSTGRARQRPAKGQCRPQGSSQAGQPVRSLTDPSH